MVDMTHKGSHVYWSTFQDTSVYRVINFMETVEEWTLDSDLEVSTLIKGLGDKLDQMTKVDTSLKEQIIKFIAYIKTSRNLRFLQALDQITPGTASKIISYAEENQFNNHHCYIFIFRNIIFERLRIMSRVFRKDRIDIIKKALEET